MRRFIIAVLQCCIVPASLTIAGDALIVVAPEASSNVQLAAREVRRYVYLRTGELLPISSRPKSGHDSIRLVIDRALKTETYRLKTESAPDRSRTLVLSGGSDVAVLYAACHYAETMGVRFYLHGDVIPDRKIPFVLPELDETRSPLFETRGLLPFHDFTEGPDWWEADDYKVHFTQMAKMRMNIMGLHCYPESGVGPEPLVWIGHPDDVGADGKVAFSSSSFWASTSGSAWGYAPVATRDFAAGAGRLFAEDDFGPSVTRGHRPRPRTPEACNEVFNRTASMLRDAFSYGRQLGVKLCIGTETPLTIPHSVKARLKEKGLDPNKQDVVQKVYEGMFTRIARAFPVDYYWLWTPESWTWNGANQQQIDATVSDIKAALAALNKAGNPFEFGTCGWVLGPEKDRALYDNLLPKSASMSCINRNIGFNWVDRDFIRIKDRPKWAIPWIEDDSAMVLPQLWAGRIRRDAADALSYGCTGLMGIHWRTKILAPNMAALMQASWSGAAANPAAGAAKADPDDKVNDRTRDLPCGDLYTNMVVSWFGPEVAVEMARLFVRYDGDGGARGVIQGRATLPRPNTWLYGPGAVVACRAPWKEVSKNYAFIDEMALLRNRVKGAGNLARFDYWLNTFRFLRALDEAACLRGELDAVMEQLKAEKDAGRRKLKATSNALPVRIRLSRAWEAMMTYLLAVTDTPGELGTIANLEQSTRFALKFLDGHDKELSDALGAPLPDVVKISCLYTGEPRLVVPTIRTVVARNEILKLQVIVLDNKPASEIRLFWRKPGAWRFSRMPLRHVARGVYEVTLPVVPEEGIEYYVSAKTAGGRKLIWPATAPEINHTLVQMP